MYGLFRDADLRLDADLKALKTHLDDPETFAAKQFEIQDSLYALGKEALDENAEWLLLHRARPLEPVMTG